VSAKRRKRINDACRAEPSQTFNQTFAFAELRPISSKTIQSPPKHWSRIYTAQKATLTLLQLACNDICNATSLWAGASRGSAMGPVTEDSTWILCNRLRNSLFCCNVCFDRHITMCFSYFSLSVTTLKWFLYFNELQHKNALLCIFVS